MPELPEVETVRLGLLPVLEGRRLLRVAARRADLRFPLPIGFAERVVGRRVDAIDRRGKFLLLRLDSDMVMIVHLGMSGRIKIDTGDDPCPARHDHVIFATDAGATLKFHDPRRFGFIDLVAGSDVDRHAMLAKLGPDPLGTDFDAAFLNQRLAGRSSPVKTAILDQRVVAGMGNIYASESLFRARLSPRRRAATVTGGRAARLTAAIKSVFAEAIAAGGSSLRDHRQPSGDLGYFQNKLAVYGRAGLACPDCQGATSCDGGIRRIVQGGRSTFYCAKRQR